MLIACEQAHLIGKGGDPQSRAGEAGEKNGARKSETARELLNFEFCPTRGVMSAFHKHLISIQ